MFRKFFDKLFKQQDVSVPVVEPVAVQQPVEKSPCGCGRSPTGYCIGLHNLTEDEWKATMELGVRKSQANESIKVSAPKTKKSSNTSKVAAWPFDGPADVKPAVIKSKRKTAQKDIVVSQVPPPVSPILTKKAKKKTKTKNV